MCIVRTDSDICKNLPTEMNRSYLVPKPVQLGRFIEYTIIMYVICMLIQGYYSVNPISYIKSLHMQISAISAYRQSLISAYRHALSFVVVGSFPLKAWQKLLCVQRYGHCDKVVYIFVTPSPTLMRR